MSGRFLFWTLAALIALAPLPLASNRMWAWSLIALVSGILMIVWAVGHLAADRPAAVPLYRHAPATIAFLLVLLWAFVQALPGLPGIAPHPMWQLAAESLGSASPHAAVSLDPGATITWVLRLMAYGATFWIAMQLCRDADRAQALLWVIVLSGSAYAFYGLIVEFSGARTILWYRKWAYADALTATFVNRNSFAAYIGMVAMAALALFAHELDRARASNGEIAGRLVDTLDNLRGRAYALFGCLLVIGTALLLTHSRAGTASAGVGAVVFLAALSVYRWRQGGRFSLFSLVALAGMVVLLATSGQGTLQRLATVEDSLIDRSAVWSMTRQGIAQRPFAGTGLGSFDDVYLAQRDDRLAPSSPPFLRAHNSYLEGTLELGLPAYALLVGALVWLAGWCVHGVAVRRRHGIYPCAALGALSLGAVHAMFDFSLQIPAVTLCLMALLGAGCAQSNRSAAS